MAAFSILVPVDGSKNSDRAVKQAIEMAKTAGGGTIHLLNVQPPVSGVIQTFVGKGDIDSYHREEGAKGLKSAKRICANAGVDAVEHIGVGRPGAQIAAFAKKLKARQIVMGTRGHSGVAGVLLGSVAQDVIAHASAPVSLVK
jgi:nucleotide-binding universal stress UspA family protein